MPNRVFYIDDNTPYKVIEALTDMGDLNLQQAMTAIRRLKDAGINLVENAKNQPGQTAVADNAE